jgi:hypothetical protein
VQIDAVGQSLSLRQLEHGIEVLEQPVHAGIADNSENMQGAFALQCV